MRKTVMKNTFMGKTKNSENSVVKLNRIVAKGLFGKVDYDLDLRTEGDVAILIAPNGFGKTTLLKLIYATLCPTYRFFNEHITKIVFDSFTCELSNGMSITLSRGHYGYHYNYKTENKHKTEKPQEEIDELRKGGVESALSQWSDLGWNFLFSVHASNAIPSTNEYGDTVYGGETEFYLLEEAMSSNYQLGVPRIPSGIAQRGWFDRYQENFIDAFRSIRKAIHAADNNLGINFVTSNRLRKQRRSFSENTGAVIDRRTRTIEAENKEEDPLILASEDLEERVFEKLAEYNRKKNEASNNLPRIYAKQCHAQPRGYDVFLKNWEHYTNTLRSFQEMGFLDSAETNIDNVSEDDYEAAGAFFDTYLDTFEATVIPLAEIYRQFDIFKKIFDERIGNNDIAAKTIRFTPMGVKLFLDETRPIEITELSSGEKNDFLMFYNLIFNSTQGELFLIDEPEISLHIDWQESYVDRLLDICNENNLQAIITTHSPHIVNDHLDLVKDL